MVNPNENGEDILQESTLTFSDNVQSVIEDVFPSTDPLEAADFNVVDYINNIFPTEQSLSNIDEVVLNVEGKIKRLDTEIKVAVRGQTVAGADGQVALDEAQKAIFELFAKIKSIKDRAEQSEKMVKEITRDIKQLDQAKRNLTQAITTHNHLHMLISGVETLQNLARKRQFGEAASLLQGILNVMEHFTNLKSIPTIRDLSNRVDDIKQELTKSVITEFENAFSSHTNSGGLNAPFLRQACAVADVLEPFVKKDLLKKFVKNQLAEYVVLFDASQDTAWLDKIDRRYAWIKRCLVDFEDKLAKVFPESWEVSEIIVVEFCYITHKELSSLMQKRTSEIDVNLLLFAIQRTTTFENLLAKRLTGNTIKESISQPKPEKKSENTEKNPFLEDVKGEEISENENNVDSNKPGNSFERLISRCFEPYLYIYIESQDRNLADLINKFQDEFQAQVQQMKASEAHHTGSGVLGSCADLFVYYKKCMVQCSQLSAGDPMIALTILFQKHLKEYSSRILMNNLPKTTTTNVSLASNITFSTVTNLLKETTTGSKDAPETARLSPAELTLTCSILTTADYCLETTQQLEDKLKEKVEPKLAKKVDLTDDRTTFSTVISNCIQLMVQDLESACEPSLVAMTKQSWTTIGHVGDQSQYVNAITGHMKQTVPIIRGNLSSARKYFTQFCIKFANSFIPRFVSALCKCKPIGTVGAEQLLLDTHSLKTMLLDLPSIVSQVNRKAPSSYTKIVVKGMTKAEMLLKIVMTPHEPNSNFISSTIRLLVDPDVDTFQKILEMKGLRKIEQTALIDVFKAKRPHSENSTATNISGDDSMSRIRKLEKLIKKRL